MKKKAQSISINTIVVAAIALTVMILVILIFTGNLKIFGEGTKNCINNGGTCVESSTACAEEYGRVQPAYGRSCEEADEDLPVCCLITG